MGRGPKGAPMVGGVRMLDGSPGGVLPLESGMPGSGLPGEAGMPMYFRARSSMPVAQYITFLSEGTNSQIEQKHILKLCSALCTCDALHCCIHARTYLLSHNTAAADREQVQGILCAPTWLCAAGEGGRRGEGLGGRGRAQGLGWALQDSIVQVLLQLVQLLCGQQRLFARRIALLDSVAQPIHQVVLHTGCLGLHTIPCTGLSDAFWHFIDRQAAFAGG